MSTRLVSVTLSNIPCKCQPENKNVMDYELDTRGVPYCVRCKVKAIRMVKRDLR